MLRRTRNIVVAGALMMAFALAGCTGGGEPEAAAPAPEGQHADIAPLSVAELDKAGMDEILAQSKGKAVFLCFWSVTCPACDKEIPELEKLTEAYGGDELRLMLINVDPTAGSIGKYFGEYRPVSEVYHGSDDLVEAYGVYRIPHLVLYTAEGEKFLDQAGFFPSKMLQSLVEHALGRGKMGSS